MRHKIIKLGHIKEINPIIDKLKNDTSPFKLKPPKKENRAFRIKKPYSL